MRITEDLNSRIVGIGPGTPTDSESTTQVGESPGHNDRMVDELTKEDDAENARKEKEKAAAEIACKQQETKKKKNKKKYAARKVKKKTHSKHTPTSTQFGTSSGSVPPESGSANDFDTDGESEAPIRATSSKSSEEEEPAKAATEPSVSTTSASNHEAPATEVDTDGFTKVDYQKRRRAEPPVDFTAHDAQMARDAQMDDDAQIAAQMQKEEFERDGPGMRGTGDDQNPDDTRRHRCQWPDGCDRTTDLFRCRNCRRILCGRLGGPGEVNHAYMHFESREGCYEPWPILTDSVDEPGLVYNLDENEYVRAGQREDVAVPNEWSPWGAHAEEGRETSDEANDAAMPPLDWYDSSASGSFSSSSPPSSPPVSNNVAAPNLTRHLATITNPLGYLLEVNVTSKSTAGVNIAVALPEGLDSATVLEPGYAFDVMILTTAAAHRYPGQTRYILATESTLPRPVSGHAILGREVSETEVEGTSPPSGALAFPITPSNGVNTGDLGTFDATTSNIPSSNSININSASAPARHLEDAPHASTEVIQTSTVPPLPVQPHSIPITSISPERPTNGTRPRVAINTHMRTPQAQTESRTQLKTPTIQAFGETTEGALFDQILNKLEVERQRAEDKTPPKERQRRDRAEKQIAPNNTDSEAKTFEVLQHKTSKQRNKARRHRTAERHQLTQQQQQPPRSYAEAVQQSRPVNAQQREGQTDEASSPTMLRAHSIYRPPPKLAQEANRLAAESKRIKEQHRQHYAAQENERPAAVPEAFPTVGDESVAYPSERTSLSPVMESLALLDEGEAQPFSSRVTYSSTGTDTPSGRSFPADVAGNLTATHSPALATATLAAGSAPEIGTTSRSPNEASSIPPTPTPVPFNSPNPPPTATPAQVAAPTPFQPIPTQPHCTHSDCTITQNLWRCLKCSHLFCDGWGGQSHALRHWEVMGHTACEQLYWDGVEAERPVWDWDWDGWVGDVSGEEEGAGDGAAGCGEYGNEVGEKRGDDDQDGATEEGVEEDDGDEDTGEEQDNDGFMPRSWSWEPEGPGGFEEARDEQEGRRASA